MATHTTGQVESGTVGWRSIRGRYESALWRAMDLLGVSESVERKMTMAVLLQFLATLAVFALPLAFLGPREAFSVFPTAQIVLTGVVFVLAVIAFGSTILIARRDIIEPLDGLRETAEMIANGQLESRPDASDQVDETGDLERSFVTMYEYLTTVSRQADALAREEFEASVLDEPVPGEFGESLAGMQTRLQERIDDLETSRQRIDSQREAVEQRNAALEADAERVRAVLRQCADGNFTDRVEIESDHEAMCEIADGVNTMLDDVEATLREVQTLAEEVDEVGAEVSTSVTEMEHASAEVSQSAEQISAVTDRQNDRFEEVFGEMSDLSATIEEIAATADGVAEVSQRASERARNGRETASDAVAELERIEQQSASLVGRIETLERELDEVSEIVDVIDEIAEETNLLAVNASIEAARAGVDGSGFTVVANEVKALSEETSKSTKEVDEIVRDVQASATETVDEIRQMQADVADGAETIEESLSVLKEIAERVQEANDGVQSINDATDEQARTSQEVVSMVDEATEQSEQTLQETSNVAAAAQEQAATVAEISNAAQSLSQTATELTGQLDQFTVTN
ncbi:methyl-accepting chemotaxis protein [Halobacteria archaeon AArc-dxtr1]|nr:methyl-accepting chemotaxis protein [Halobacteria archaeon AArc-dxtr1]